MKNKKAERKYIKFSSLTKKHNGIVFLFFFITIIYKDITKYYDLTPQTQSYMSLKDKKDKEDIY